MEDSKIESGSYKVYGYRYVVLGSYLLITATIQLLWATFFSITTDAWRYYGFTSAAEGEGAITMLSIIFMAGMIILSIPSMIAFEKWGFKKAVGFGAALMAVCGLVRGFFGSNFTVVTVMTVGFAIAQPFILNAPGLVAGKWFPESERATANSVGLLANYLGMGIGLLVTPILLEGGMSIQTMLLVYGIVAAVSAGIFLVFAKEKPPTPPCAEEDAQRADFKEGFKIAMRRKNFLISVVVFFFLLGVFNTFFTMIEPIISSMTGGSVDATGAGIVGVAILLAGIVGSVIIATFSDKDKRHRRLPYIIVCNIVGTIGLILFMIFNGFPGMLASGLLYGFFTIGSAPVVLTFAAEAAYPASEGTSEGFLMFAGNVGGVVLLGISGLFGANHYSIMILMAVISALCILLMSMAKETKLQ
jgi:FLVCR family MFS transporter 7